MRLDDHIRDLDSGLGCLGHPLSGAARKPHVKVSRDRYVEVLREVGSCRVDDLAEFLDVTPGTARRWLDGLVAGGEAEFVGGSGVGREYRARGRDT